MKLVQLRGQRVQRVFGDSETSFEKGASVSRLPNFVTKNGEERWGYVQNVKKRDITSTSLFNMFNMTSSSHLPVLQAGTLMFTPFCLESFSRAFRRAKRRFAGNHIHVIDGRVEPVCIGCFPIFRALQVHKLPDHLGSMHLEKKQKTASMDLHGTQNAGKKSWEAQWKLHALV